MPDRIKCSMCREPAVVAGIPKGEPVTTTYTCLACWHEWTVRLPEGENVGQ